MALQSIVFDLDDTLIVEETVALESLKEAVSVIVGDADDATVDVALAAIRARWRSGPWYPLCLELGIASWEGLWASFEGSHRTLDGLRDWVPAYRKAAWSAVAQALGRPDPRIERDMDRRFVWRQRRGHRVVDGAGTLLESLSSAYSLGLVTNGPADIQRWKLARSELAPLFRSVVISGETGVGKPDSRAFHRVLDDLGVNPINALMVGDSWERDVQGALGAGLGAVWVARGRCAPRTDRRVEQIDSIGQLHQVL